MEYHRYIPPALERLCPEGDGLLYPENRFSGDPGSRGGSHFVGLQDSAGGGFVLTGTDGSWKMGPSKVGE